MKRLRDFFRLPIARRWFGDRRRQPVKRSITVPAPLPVHDSVRVLELCPRPTGTHAANDAAGRQLPRCVVNA